MQRPSTRVILGVGAIVIVTVAIWAYTELSPPSLTGAWSNGAPENRIDFTFNPDGSGTMAIGSSRLDYRYTFDRTKRPAWLDLDAAPNGEPVTIRAIAEFAPGGKLKIRLPPTRAFGIRPTEFVDNDIENTILLKRAESAS